MAIWIQSLSWTLIYALGQGFVVYASLWIVLKLMPETSANVKYHLSLSALTILLVWFVTTLWQQFHSLMLTNEQSVVYPVQHANTIRQQISNIGAIEKYDIYRWVLSSVKVIFPWLSAFYIIGLVLMLVRLLAGVRHLFSLRKSGIRQPDAIVNELLISLKRKLHYEGRVQLFISAKAQVPMVIGFFKPMILMPAATIAQLTTEQLETILLHELAHIKRYDYVVNILQTVVETIIFFNPFVWMISAIIRREREHCCDDLVLDHTREPLFYATALAAVAVQPGTVSAFTVAASGSNHLFNRIKRIIEMKKNPFSYSRMVAAILIIAAITFSIAWLTPSFARTDKDKLDNASPHQSTAVQKDTLNTYQSEESELIARLIGDGLVNQVNGFIVEKKQNKLYINGREQTSDISNKYLSTIQKEVIRVEVFSFQERLQQHPDASFIQILLPVTLSSPCVQYTPRKDSC